MLGLLGGAPGFAATLMGDGKTRIGPAEIVITEGDADLRRTMVDVIRELVGLNTMSFPDIESALASLSCPGAVSLFFVDISPPLTDGLVVIENLRRSFPRVKLVAMSGAVVEQPAILAGAAVFLQKPFGLDLVANILDRWRPGCLKVS